ncbi:MAG: InlB B-repeat-containing protein, partial [Bacillota bacterium]
TERVSNLETIEDFAFRNAIELTEISIGNYVEHIGRGVFNGCLSLEKIMINESSNTDNNYFIVKDGVLFQKNMDLIDQQDNFGTILHTYPAGRIDDVYELPIYGNDGVTHILEYAFYYSNVTAIKVPFTIESIERNAFIIPQLVYIEFDSEIPIQTYNRLFPVYDPEKVIIDEGDDSDYSTFGFPQDVEVSHSDEINTTYLLGIVENGEGDKFVYRNDERGVYIVAGERAKASLSVPYEVEIDSQTYDITALESYSFRGNLLKELTIPYTIENINEYALYYCTDLRRLTSHSDLPPALEYSSELEEEDELLSFSPDTFIENLLIFVPDGQQSEYVIEWPTHIDYIIAIGSYPQVTFETNGGSQAVVIDPDTGDEIDITERDDIPHRPRTQRTGYDFEGWYEDEDFEGDKVSFPYEKYRNIIFYAKWTVQTFELDYFLSGGTFEETPETTVSYGQFYVLTVPTRPGYNFMGWFDVDDRQFTDGEGTGLGVGSAEHEANGTWGIIQDEFELIAHWEPAEYTVTYDPNGGEVTDEFGEPVNQKTVSYNSNFTLDVPEREGYDFTGWRDTDNSPITGSMGNSIAVWSFIEDKTVTARWKALTYTVRFDDGFEGYYEDMTVTYGSDFEFPVPEREDSVFFGWYDGPEGTGTQYTNQFGDSVRNWDKTHESGGHIVMYAQWPIDISSVADFDTIRENPEGSYILTNDIVINIPWEPIGIDDNAPFTGILDGNGYAITNLQINDQFEGYLGVIGYNKGIVRNLNVGLVYEQLPDDGGEAPNYDGRAEFSIFGDRELYVGGVAGYNEGDIQNCEIAIEINVVLNAEDTDMYVGGVAGYNSGMIEDTEITVQIDAEYDYDVTEEGERYIGSIAGYHETEGEIAGCYYNRIVESPDLSPMACGNEDDSETFGSYEATGTSSSPSFW